MRVLLAPLRFLNSALALLPLALIKFYRRYRRSVFFFIPVDVCRYEPTCSAYGLLAYQRFGFFWGTALTAWRITRCNPWTHGGLDPVPEKKTAR
jgi:putative membrane protein insertion efficiency factor